VRELHGRTAFEGALVTTGAFVAGVNKQCEPNQVQHRKFSQFVTLFLEGHPRSGTSMQAVGDEVGDIVLKHPPGTHNPFEIVQPLNFEQSSAEIVLHPSVG
jgi:hypothetical protein